MFDGRYLTFTFYIWQLTFDTWRANRAPPEIRRRLLLPLPSKLPVSRIAFVVFWQKDDTFALDMIPTLLLACSLQPTNQSINQSINQPFLFGIWSSLYDIWYLIFDMWYFITSFDIWYSVFGIWYLVPGIWYLVYGIWYLVFGIYLVFDIWYLIFSISQLILDWVLIDDTWQLIFEEPIACHRRVDVAYLYRFHSNHLDCGSRLLVDQRAAFPSKSLVITRAFVASKESINHIWYLMFDVWYLIFDIWYLMLIVNT